MNSSATKYIAYNVYDSLLAATTQGEISPCLATAVPATDNGLITTAADGKPHISFPIRQGVLFHSGNTLVAEDVKYTFMRGIISGGTTLTVTPALIGSGNFKTLVEEVGLAEAFAKLDNAITVEGDNVVFHLDAPFSPFLSIIADNGMAYGVMSKEWAVAQGAWPGTLETVEDYMSLTSQTNALQGKMNGTGPFKLAAWETERIDMERFDDYWQGPAKLRRVILQFTTDAATIVQMLLRGDADFMGASVAELLQLEGQEGIVVVKNLPVAQLLKVNFNFNIQGDQYLGNKAFGSDGAPANMFSDINVRKAFCYTFDRDKLINEVLLGAGLKPYGPVLVGYPTANPDNPCYSLDLAKAEEYFRQAFDGEMWEKGFKVLVPISEGSTMRQGTFEIIQANLKKINPKFILEITTLPWAAYVAAVDNHEVPLSIFGILPTYQHPYFALSSEFYSGGAYAEEEGYTELAKEKYDALVEEAGRTFDNDRLQEISYILQKYAYDDALSIFTYQAVGQVAMRDWIHGFTPTPLPSQLNWYTISKG
jgi:peptide/nickel transport system substrate-binding protein